MNTSCDTLLHQRFSERYPVVEWPVLLRTSTSDMQCDHRFRPWLEKLLRKFDVIIRRENPCLIIDYADTELFDRRHKLPRRVQAVPNFRRPRNDLASTGARKIVLEDSVWIEQV